MGASANVAIYDCTQVKIFAFGVQISKGPGASGYGKEVFLEIEQDGQSWIVVKGADGSMTRCATNEPGTKLKVHLMQTSSSNAVFSAMWNLDIKGKNGAGIGTFASADLQGTSIFESEACWVVGPPARGYGKEAGELIWELYCGKVERFDGGN
jgi:hypothetical protein